MEHYHEDFPELFVLHVQLVLIFQQHVELEILLDQHRKINFEFPNKLNHKKKLIKKKKSIIKTDSTSILNR